VALDGRREHHAEGGVRKTETASVDRDIVEVRAEQRRADGSPVVEDRERRTHRARADDGDHARIVRAAPPCVVCYAALV
jgi:hypothetical protein